MESVYSVARSVVRLQQLYGRIPHIKGKGNVAKVVTVVVVAIIVVVVVIVLDVGCLLWM